MPQPVCSAAPGGLRRRCPSRQPTFTHYLVSKQRIVPGRPQCTGDGSLTAERPRCRSCAAWRASMRAHCNLRHILCMPEACQGRSVCCSPSHACLGAVKSRDACTGSCRTFFTGLEQGHDMNGSGVKAHKTPHGSSTHQQNPSAERRHPGAQAQGCLHAGDSQICETLRGAYVPAAEYYVHICWVLCDDL